MIRWPWTNLHELNLSWIIQQMKSLIERVDAFGNRITAGSVDTLPAGQSASVIIRGGLDDGLTFDFQIPRGNTGATGPQGPQGVQGPKGDSGNSFTIKGLVASVNDLPANASVGDAYGVGTSSSNEIYLFNGLTWDNMGPLSGPQGAQGPQGPQGEKGDPGQGIVYYATCTTGSSVEVKDAVSDGDEIFLNVGDVVAVRFSEGNIHLSPSLHVDDNGTYPIYGWKNTSGDVEGAPLIDRNVTVLFKYDGFAFNIIGGPVGAAVTDGVPKSGILSALQASRLNFGYQEIPANTTTAVQISLTKNGAQPFVNVCAWAMTALTYELLKPGTDYEASMNIMATGNTTLTFRLLSARQYPVYVVVTGNAAVH